MKKGLKIALISIIGFVLILAAALHMVLNSKVLTNLVDKYAKEYVDGTLKYSKIKISLLPRTHVALDDVWIVYPHERFAAWETSDAANRLLDSGRGAQEDTLAGFDHFYARLKPLKLLRGTISMPRISLEGCRAYIHQFDSTTTNLGILRFASSEDEEESSELSLPKISIGKVHVDAPSVVYTDHPSEIGLFVPVKLDGVLDFIMKGEMMGVDVEKLDAEIAYVPMHLDGKATMYPDSLILDARAAIIECPLDSVLRRYADNYVEQSRAVTTDALLSLDLSAEGVLTPNQTPAMSLCVRIPESHTHYSPMRLDLKLAADVDADLDTKHMLKADIHEFLASIPGLSIRMDGEAEDLLGKDPCFKLDTKASASLASLKRFIPSSLGIGEARGDLALDLKVHAHQSELQTLEFHHSTLDGCLKSNSLEITMPADTLYARMFETDIDITSGEHGIELRTVFDSLHVNKGLQLTARLREMDNVATLSKEKNRAGDLVPKLTLSHDGGRIFAKYGSSRVGIRGTDIDLTALKRTRRPARSVGDRVREYQRREGMMRYQEHSDGDFNAADVDIRMDTTITKYLRDWSLSGHMKADGGFFASPMLPLRTRLTAMHLDFDPRSIDVDTLGVEMGSSDFGAKGSAKGIFRALSHKGMIDVDLALDSRRLNVNELVAALNMGEQDLGEVSLEDEADESFVLDNLEDAELSSEEIPLVIVPGNVRASLRLRADRIDYTDLELGPVTASARMQDRTVRIDSAKLASTMGSIRMDAFYSTKSKKDITTGVDLRLRDMNAYDIIHILPSVDSLMPAIKSFRGNLSCDLSITSQLDSNMNFVIPSADGLLRIKGRDLEVTDAGDLRKITRLLLFKDKNIGHIQDLNVDAVLHNGKLDVFPFELGVDRYRLALYGSQKLDRSMFYHVSILKSPFLIRFGINMIGTLDKWRMSLGRAKYSDARMPAFSEQMDAVQINFAESIRNIFSTGVENVVRHNESEMERLNAAKPDDSPELMTPDEHKTVDDLFLEQELAEQEALLQDEVDAILEETFLDTSSLVKGFEEMTYSRKVEKKMNRMQKKAAKKGDE